MGQFGSDELGGPDLRELREARGLTQTAVARFVGVVQPAVSSWESGQIAVPLDRRRLLQQLFGLNAEQLDAAIARSSASWEQQRDDRLGEQIRRLRAEQGIARQLVAESAAVTSGAVAWWESGVSRPEPTKLRSVAEFFGTTPEQLLNDAGWTDTEIEEYLHPQEQERNAVAVLLRAAREAAGLNQMQVAAATGSVQNSISAIELGHHLPNEELWSKLIELYGLDPVEAAVARHQARRDAGTYPEVALPWPLDPSLLPRPRWFRQLRAHLGLTRGELAERIGVEQYVIASSERPDTGLPRGMQDAGALRRLAEVSMSSELALRQAWQGEGINGLEHLVGLDGAELIEAANEAWEVFGMLSLQGVTFQAMGDACGVTREAVRQWVGRRGRPRDEAVLGLARLLGIDEHHLHDLIQRQEAVRAHVRDARQSPVTPGPADRIFGAVLDEAE